MHRKYAERGLVIITVSLDPANDKASVEEAAKHLRTNSMRFTNLLLDEPEEMWSAKFDFNHYFFFDRQGRWKVLRGGEFHGKDKKKLHEAKEAIVRQMLEEK